MATSHGNIKHLSLHRLDNVELRVLADSEQGILRLEQAELDVVGRFAADPRWQHTTVTLFALADLQPLLHQLEALGRTPADARLQQREELLSRPLVNVYDLASPAACNVFVNRKAMIAAGYWEDVPAILGLLAHEHAHPLAECPCTAALRQLRPMVDLHLEPAWAADAQQAQRWAERAQRQIAALSTQLFITGPREVFTNEIAIAAGFEHALYHLNRRNVRNLLAGLNYRPALAAQLAAVVAQRQLSKPGAALLQLLGDLQAFLPLAMEVAPFRRLKRHAKVRELVKPLETRAFPQLEPCARTLFDALVATYVGMDADETLPGVRASLLAGLERANQALAPYGAELRYQVEELNPAQPVEAARG